MALGKHANLNFATGNQLVDQWNPTYPALAFPFSFRCRVGGPDFPNRNRDKERRGTKVGLEAPKLDPWMFCRMLAARAEASIRYDWALVPAVRNLTTKFDELCGDDVACRHPVATDIAGQSHAAELTQAAANLYKRLANGYYSSTVVDGRSTTTSPNCVIVPTSASMRLTW